MRFTEGESVPVGCGHGDRLAFTRFLKKWTDLGELSCRFHAFSSFDVMLDFIVKIVLIKSDFYFSAARQHGEIGSMNMDM